MKTGTISLCATLLVATVSVTTAARADCNSGSPCLSHTNSGTGAGIAGKGPISGVTGETTGSGFGVVGADGVNGNATGIFGQTTTGKGVWGSAIGAGNGGYFQAGSGGTALNARCSGGTAAWFEGNIYVNGTPHCYGCTTFTNLSDIRLKKEIKPLEGGSLDLLLQLRPVTFEWKEPQNFGNLQGPQRGFIAQDVEKILPEWVSVDARSGFKTINTRGLEAMLVESLRTLKKENDALRERSSKLEDRVKALESGHRLSTATLDGTGLAIGGIAALGLMPLGLVVASRRRKSQPSSPKPE